MMVNKRLIDSVSESKKYIATNVVLQWVSLGANIVLMFSIAHLIGSLAQNTVDAKYLGIFAGIALAVLVVRHLCTVGSTKMAYMSSQEVKKLLRKKIYEKLLKIGPSYKENVMSSEAVQVSVEGVDQLETYFGAYLPQFFYSLLAPLTLFIVLCFIHWQTALVLLFCVPMIPMAIAAVQTWAKKLFSKYWGRYTSLGDSFLENLQGLTTLKIYKADQFKNDAMNEEAENFRKITMRVLTMQLNSITIMDLVAYGGAALGVIMATMAYANGEIQNGLDGLTGCLAIILLSADFFIPMRRLGSFFHVAMNGMAASDKIFRILDLEESDEDNKQELANMGDVVCKDVHFSYNEDREILHGVNLTFPVGKFTAIVGESGCGKSTIAALLTGKNKNYKGSITINGIELSQIKDASLLKHITYISNNSYLFRGTVKENLLMGKEDATDEELWAALERVNLSEFLKSENGLETVLLDKASNLSGGQRQRLALARALLYDSPAFIFDEATSNIDVESEEKIMEQVKELAKTKTVILISHRLANVTDADNIYVVDSGDIAESGTHKALLEKKAMYEKLWTAQQALENYGKEGATK